MDAVSLLGLIVGGLLLGGSVGRFVGANDCFTIGNDELGRDVGLFKGDTAEFCAVAAICLHTQQFSFGVIPDPPWSP